ncbi:ATP-binding protein [Cytophagaceae bacterium YF14B1]|uniref:ATP-binding protein n=1 Tax=Xanthocytophaga flava TaxID=3048013 RepID=A0AAE3U9A4_9BACT|nr:ATP-binding protein [Xanthocytophaga flavus]MDJ1483482.1 ATP-binding protein [Xanthocytophaga flavus]
MEKATFLTNIAGKVRNTRLPKAKALWPLYEVISNSIHAIEEKGILKDGYVKIYIVRQGDPNVLRTLGQVEVYPIKSFKIVDNGIGFNDSNFTSFLTAESDYKVEKGAKGVGRFVCLKAFNSVHIKSMYTGKGSKHFTREFTLKPQGNGIFDYTISEHENEFSDELSTTVTLNQYIDDYNAHCPRLLNDLAEKIIEHFLIYFILDKCPKIDLIDSNEKTYNINELYDRTVKPFVQSDELQIKGNLFKISLVYLYEVKNVHRIHYCANERDVRYEKLSKFIPDLGDYQSDTNGDFTYQVYVTGDYLDANTDNERTGFLFPVDDEPQTEEEEMIISLKDIRIHILSYLEEKFNIYLSALREAKLIQYKEHVYYESPQFRPLIKYMEDDIKKLPPNLSGNKLNLELYKLEMELEMKVKELGDTVLGSIADPDEYMALYEEYIEKFNDIGKANLAKYVVHRKSIIELLDKFLGQDDNEELQTEETIHKIFFPLRKISDEVNYERQNLWLIDERLTYHNYLASDKQMRAIDVLEDNDSNDRPDILVFNNSFAFVDDDAPHNSFVIIEFKRPERNTYSSDDEKKNPVDQIISYIRTIRENKAKDRKGKIIQVDKDRTPFYAYIVCDFNANFNRILEDRSFKKTPDGKGYFFYHTEYYAYIEVISYQKLLKDAKMRNRVLFDKLGLPH